MIEIKVEGLDRVIAGMSRLNGDLTQTMNKLGAEVSREILLTRGVQRYPPQTSANMPPTPFYIRGEGTMTGSGLRRTSERLGSNWTVDTEPLLVRIGNSTSYAPYVHGEEQASFMAPKGWRKLVDVAAEKVDKLKSIIQGWVDRLIKDAGL